MLVGAVGEDFVEYRAWLERHHVDCALGPRLARPGTPRGSCAPTTRSHAQIASFYAGAMSEAREIELKPIADRAGEPDYVLIGPNDPEAMLRHTDECRQRGYRFVADPSQQLAFSDGELIRPLIDGADILFSNEYEAALITQKTGWSADEVLSRVGTWVVTLGAAGVRIDRKGEESITVAGGARRSEKVEPTGVGDAFRAGFLAALSWGLAHGARRAARLPARGLRRRAGRHPGVHPVPVGVPRPLPADVRRRGGRRHRAAPARRSGPEASLRAFTQHWPGSGSRCAVHAVAAEPVGDPLHERRG